MAPPARMELAYADTMGIRPYPIILAGVRSLAPAGCHIRALHAEEKLTIKGAACGGNIVVISCVVRSALPLYKNRRDAIKGMSGKILFSHCCVIECVNKGEFDSPPSPQILNDMHNNLLDVELQCEFCAWAHVDPDNGRTGCGWYGYYTDNMAVDCSGPWTPALVNRYLREMQKKRGNQK